MTHDELVKVAVRWLSKPWRNASAVGGHGTCSVIVSEMTTAASETPDALGFHSGRTTLIECKASIADFRTDRKKYFRVNPEMGLGTYRYFMVPRGLLDGVDVPEGWGVIDVAPTGKTRVVKVSGRFEPYHQGEKDVLLSLLCRLKVPAGRHVKIRVYKMDDGSEPRATAHLRSEAVEPDNGPLFEKIRNR